MDQNRQPFDGRNYIVTGATQGLGRQIALDLAKQGAEGILICGRNSENGEGVRAEIESTGCRCRFVKADLQFEDDCRRVVSEAMSAFGSIHGLVNAAGLTDRGGLEDATVDNWNLLMNVNARAPFILMQETVRHMKTENSRKYC